MVYEVTSSKWYQEKGKKSGDKTTAKTKPMVRLKQPDEPKQYNIAGGRYEWRQGSCHDCTHILHYGETTVGID